MQGLRLNFMALHFLSPPFIECQPMFAFPCISNETAMLPDKEVVGR